MRWWEALGAALQLSLAGEGVGRRCNGHAALCHRRYSNISWIGAHNSAFVGQSAFNNQGATVRQQLEKGVRFLQAQTRNKEGQIEMCHTYCWARDAGPLRGYLGEVADWLRRRPDEVLTLLLTNYEAIPVESYDAEFAAAGLKPYLFRPGRVLAKEEWPTLQTMIGAGERLVVFMGGVSLSHDPQRPLSRLFFSCPPAWRGLPGLEEMGWAWLMRRGSHALGRLPCGSEQGRLHPGRVRLLLGDALWHHRQELSHLRGPASAGR